MLRHAAQTWIDAGLEPVIVVISGDRRLRAALDGLQVTLVENAQPERGISSSIALGIQALNDKQLSALIGVADQPYLTVEAIRELLAASRPGRMVVPRYNGYRGNPVIFDRRFFPELLGLDGDRGGQRVVAAHPDAVIEVQLAPQMGRDLDRPEDLPR